jgi:hypothetical protein
MPGADASLRVRLQYAMLNALNYLAYLHDCQIKNMPLKGQFGGRMSLPDSPHLEGLCMTDTRTKRKKARLLSFDEMDGRTAAARRARSIVVAIQNDVGVDLSEAERQLAQRAGILGAWLSDAEVRWLDGQPFDASLYCTVVNCQRRVLETLGIRRQPRNVSPSLEAYSRQLEMATAK